MQELTVRIEALDLVRQVAQRQAGHLRAIRAHLEAHTTLSGVGGAVMACLGGQYREGRTTALEGFEQGVTISENVAAQASATRQAYVDADRAAYERLARLAASLGLPMPPFTAPGTPTLGPPGGPAAPPGSQDDGVDPWGRLTPEAVRPGVDGLRTTTGAGVRRIDAPPSNPFGPFSLRRPGEQLVDHATDRYWDWRDERTSVPGATSTARDRFEQAQLRRFAEGYDRGTQATGAGSLTHHSPWSQDRITTRTAQAGLDVYSTVTTARSAWNAIERLENQADGRDVVRAVADGRDNTANAEWAD